MQRGEVWWADLPLPVGRRPVLIVTRATAVATRNQVVVAQVTRTRHGIGSEVALTRKEGMPADSVVNCDVLLTVPKDRLLRPIAMLSAAKLAEVRQALLFALDL
jgi:mRNA interferase MazF